MNIEQILSQTTTKTRKIEQLISLGLSRTQIAALVTNGNYGFVQNVYARMKREGRLNAAAQIGFTPALFNRKFGVEIEAFNIPAATLCCELNAAGITAIQEGYNHETRTHWKTVRDSSIHGNDTFELVSPILQGQDGLEQLKKVCEVLNRLNAKVNKTCGMHIHFDASEFSLQHWKNIYKNYANYEMVIDSFMPKSRRDNNNGYCMTIRNDFKLRAIEQATSISSLVRVFGERYYKINAEAFQRHKTIEFRQHSGTVEFEKIENWIRFLHNLVEFSKSNVATESNFESMKNFNQLPVIEYLRSRINKFAARAA